jgi:TetR/AcrR family transcriptional regulator
VGGDGTAREPGPAPRRRAPRVPAAQRREGLLAAAREQFVRVGYDGARTRAIAERAGTTESVLYRHFPSKEDLFDAAVLGPLTRWVETVAVPSVDRVRAASEADRPQALLEVNRALLATMVEITPLLGAALFSTSERGRAFYREHLYPLLARSFDQTGQAMGDWARPGYSGRFLMLTGFGTFLAHALDEHFRGAEVQVEDTAALYVRLLAEGAMRPPDPDQGT